MDMAIDLFRAGVPVPAAETDHPRAAFMRLVCPRCMELVNLVVRRDTSYFAHRPWTEDSPQCPLRADSWSALRSHPRDAAPQEPLPPNTRFRDALLAAFSLTEPPEAPTGSADGGRAAAILHRVFQEDERTVTASDFADASPFLSDWWTADEPMIRGFLDRPGVLRGRLREDLRGDPGLQSEEHRQSVLLLWKHLHHPQVTDDLLLLLNVTAHLFHPVLLADLVVTSLGVLSWVPWTALWASDPEHVCTECLQTFIVPASEKPACCSCSRILCPDCVTTCTGCEDILCGRCLFRNCPACGGELCETCWHFEWECTACGTSFCEGGVEEQPAEEMEKTECDGCHEPFCGDCAEDALQDWEGESLCESCREERQQEKEEAEEEADLTAEN